MLLERQRASFPGSAVTPRYSSTESLYNVSARDVIHDRRNDGDSHGGVEQGLSHREPMRPGFYRGPLSRGRSPYESEY